MKKISAVTLSLLLILSQLAAAAEFRFSPRPNRAHQIPWRPWSREAFQEAQRSLRPVLLSLSAVWCHWCHVMDETTYSDPGIIAFIHDNFIAVRVDADRRPDIDALYNQGGWPSTIILSPAGEVVAGATYLPPDEMLPWLMKNAAGGTAEKDTRREDDGSSGRTAPAQGDGAFPAETDIAEVAAMLLRAHDDHWGGFGEWQKFPIPDAVDFLLAEYRQTGKPEYRRIITVTLDRMERGDIQDHEEGGFFRYATRTDWSEPHYEKMLASNAGLISNYAIASIVLGDSSYRKTMLKTVRYVMANLYDRKTGVFYGSQDADEKYYRKKDRKGLASPFVDRTVYADSNGRMIAALLAVHQATGDAQYLAMARKAADYVIARLYTAEDGVYHYLLDNRRQVAGLLPDNVLFSLAMIDLYQATGEGRYLQTAKVISGLVAERFFDSSKGRFMIHAGTTIVSPSAAGMLQRAQTDITNYLAIILLSRVERHESSDRFRDIIRQARESLRTSYIRFTPSGAHYGTALSWNVRDTVEVTVIADGHRRRAYLAALQRVYIPQSVIRVYSPKTDTEHIRKAGYPKKEAVYVCRKKKCSPAFSQPARLPQLIDKFLANPSRP